MRETFEWVEPYKTDDGLQYHIPDYKINRVKRAYEKRDEAVAILKELIAVHGVCDHWDHHGCCQTHWVHEKEDCPIHKATLLIKELEE